MPKVIGRFAGGVALVVLAVGAGAGLAIAPLASTPAGATTTISVNNPTDTTESAANCNPVSEVSDGCTLRAALAEATSLAESVTIDLPNPGSIGGMAYEVDSSNGTLPVDDSGGTVTITGTSGAADTIIEMESSPTVGVFEVVGGTTAVIAGVTIENGASPGVGGG